MMITPVLCTYVSYGRRWLREGCVSAISFLLRCSNIFMLYYTFICYYIYMYTHTHIHTYTFIITISYYIIYLKAGLWLSPFLRCSISILRRNSGDISVISREFRRNYGRACYKTTGSTITVLYCTVLYYTILYYRLRKPRNKHHILYYAKDILCILY